MPLTNFSHEEPEDCDRINVAFIIAAKWPFAFAELPTTNSFDAHNSHALTIIACLKSSTLTFSDAIAPSPFSSIEVICG